MLLSECVLVRSSRRFYCDQQRNFTTRRRRWRRKSAGGVQNRQTKVKTATKTSYTSEFTSDISEYVVDLKTPLGFALAPDLNGQIYVAQVEEESCAAEQNVMVGDMLEQCTCALNADETCHYDDLRKIQWAINKHKEMVRLVLKRRQLVGRGRWYRCGVSGCVSFSSSWLLTPIHFPSKERGEWLNNREGKSFVVSFRRTILDDLSAKQQLRASLAAQFKTSLLDALQLPTLVLPAYSLVSQAANEDDPPYRHTDLPEDEVSTVFEQSKMEEQLNSKKLIPILPWLQVTTARLTHADILELASQCALQRLLEMTLYPCKEGVSLTGIQCDAQTPMFGMMTAAATLHRLILRRKVILQDRVKTCNILLHCEEGMNSAIATLLASYYHWYGMLCMEESIHLAEMALFAPVSRPLLFKTCEFLYSQAQERFDSVKVVWPYGGSQVQIAGELVGGWDQRATLNLAPAEFSPCFDVPKASHYLKIKDLLPGVYHYKFIVDNRWAIDRLAPRDADLNGNLNNVLYVPDKKQLHESTLRVDLYRLSAALISFRIKPCTT